MKRALIEAIAACLLLIGAYFIGRQDVTAACTGEELRETQATEQLQRRKDRAGLAAGKRTEQAQLNTDRFYQNLRTTYEDEQRNDSGIGCVLDPVSLRRWNEANAQSDAPAAGKSDDGLPQPASAEAGAERSQ